MKTNLAYILATLSFVPTLSAMEGQPTQPAPQKPVLQNILSYASAQPSPLSSEQKNQLNTIIGQTVLFEILSTSENPAQIKMCAEKIIHITQQASDVFSSQYKEAWAPRTGLAALCCCVTSVAKKLCPGYLDRIPSEDATCFLAGAWVAQVAERQPQRQSIQNGNAVLAMIEQKNETITKQRIEIIHQRQAQLAEKKAHLKAPSQDVETEPHPADLQAETTATKRHVSVVFDSVLTHVNIEETKEIAEETKKDK